MYKGHKICVVIPAYNEERLIGGVIDKIPEYVDHVVVIDDGSTDATAKVARDKGAIVVSHRKNRGVGAAFQTAVQKTLELKSDVMVNVDADGQFDPGDIWILIDPIIDGEADVVTASRFKDKNLMPRMPWSKYLGNIAMSWLISLLTGQRLYDVSCGFRAYSRETLMRLNLFGEFTYTQETLLDLVFKNIAIKEVPLMIKGKRDYGRSKITNNLFRYAYRALKIIFRAFRDYKPLKFFGCMSGFFIAIGLIMELTLFWHYIYRGRFTPYKFIGFIGGFFVAIGLLIFITGLLADILHRIKITQEEILYYKKKDFFSDSFHGPDGLKK